MFFKSPQHRCAAKTKLSKPADAAASAYTSDLGELIQTYSPACWYFGHCHGTKGGKYGSTPLVNISLGYPEEVSDPADRIAGLVIEV